ncbi:hypothetical protein L7F22_064466 [Adiantum nelumboides]|nr:hypothetical protein [Adiantum nelumboides]
MNTTVYSSVDFSVNKGKNTSYSYDGSVLKKAPKASKEAQPTKHVRFVQGQDAPLSLDVPQEPCQDASLKKAPAPKAPKEIQPTKLGLKIATPLKIAMPECQDAPLSTDVPQEQGQGATLKKPPKVNKRKAKANVKEEEGTTVPEQQNVKRLKRMKEVEVREAIERKLAVDEVKVKGHTDKEQLEKVPEVKIDLKRDCVKNKAKKHVEKGQEDEGSADKALALVGSSKRPKLQTPYVEVINGGKLVSICQSKPPCASRNTLMEKRSRMIQHLKKVHGLDVFIPQRLGGRPQGSVNNDMPKSSIRDQVRPKQCFKDVNQKFVVNRKRIEERAKNRAAHTWDILPRKAQMAMKKDTFIMQFVANHMKTVDQREEAMKKEIKSHVEESYKSRRWMKVETLIFCSDEDKSSGGSSGGSDDDGDEDAESNQDGSGDDDSNYGSDGDADDDDGGSDISGGGDDDGGGDISGGDDDDCGGDISGGGDDGEDDGTDDGEDDGTDDEDDNG